MSLLIITSSTMTSEINMLNMIYALIHNDEELASTILKCKCPLNTKIPRINKTLFQFACSLQRTNIIIEMLRNHNMNYISSNL